MKPKVMFFLYLIVFVAVLGMAYIRLAPSDQTVWHTDPETTQSTGKPNDYRLVGDASQVYNIAASELANLVDDFIQNQPRVIRLAGQVDELLITYVQRTPIMGYPDYITIKIIQQGASQSKLAIFSRSRFGHSDFGVNKRRIVEWVTAIQILVAG